MTKSGYPKYPTRHGYMSEKIQRDYITFAIAKKVLPRDAHRMEQIISRNASNDMAKSVQFWQLYSVLGQDHIVNIVRNFCIKFLLSGVYSRVSPIEGIDFLTNIWYTTGISIQKYEIS